MGFHEHLERSSIRHATAKQAFLFADGVVETPDALDFDLGKYNQEYTGAYGLLRHGILMDAWIRIVIDSDGTVTHCAHNKPMIHGIEPIMGWRTLKSKDILK